MSSGRLPSLSLSPLSFRSLRRRFSAPELERYLALRDVDLISMDQLQALKVRVDRGVSVLEDRVRATQAAARKLRGYLITGLFAATAGIVVSLVAYLQEDAVLAVASGLPGVLLASFLAFLLSRVNRDLRTLQSIRGRYTGAVEACTGMDVLLGVSRMIFEEVSTVAGESEDESD